MGSGKVILTDNRFKLTIDRLCHQLIENHNEFEETCLVGIQPRGVLLAERIHKRLGEITTFRPLRYGKLDITFYRDDFRRRDKPLTPSVNLMEFLVEDKDVLLIDDVLYTGRTVQSAMMALQHYGRPRQVELLVMVDRRFHRHLPIEANYVGMRVDAVDDAFVKVEWEEIDGQDKILLFSNKEELVKGN